MNQATVHSTEVLIVGAGPAGLALAIELGSRAISCIVVERNERVGAAPRAKTTNVRTREHLRRWGIAGKLAEASPLGLDYPSDVMFVTRLAGYPLARFENAFQCAPERNPLYSEHAQWIPQYTLEKVLKEHAQSLPSVQFCFLTELESFEQDGKGVRAKVRHTRNGECDVIASQYIVGADGARSTVRAAIGAKMEGAYGLSRNYNIVFRAPGLAAAHPHGKAIMYWQINADTPSLIGPMDSGDTWFFMPTGVPEGFKVSDAEAAELIRKATGIDLPYEIKSTDEWVASRLIADKYQDRRAILIGDACHLHPPFGGYGMNMGVADGVDLGWKLAAVLRGWGGPSLIASYAAERRPVHQRVMDEAVANHAVLGKQLTQEGSEDDGPLGVRMRAQIGAVIREAKAREFNTLGVVLGCHYHGSPIVTQEEGAAPAAEVATVTPSACPGSLAPHAWLDDGSSLYDGFGPGYTLLATAGWNAADLHQAQRDAREVGLPLTVCQPDSPALAELYQARLALIRPDQHVAWRGNTWPHDGKALLRHVCGW
ncbi:2-polyprenyl-6-methoxyphenol hydroxylase [Duganella sp. CF402]|uniref:FAD-dependent monooxygenase n=1 Tax=unclassified Duganella TaxID=2636909 RepID=UPI0008C6E421|nr:MULTISPECIES: FAD-dependent monooxygenase [unclassified Duganella]RZT08841.1 2-polyprenyl-6-methoxyphenol hydroxylase-like FAD-dependent oxidoreductase [Duganella sp. BK701]SEL79870.1 2-polyprenyl-6-methoxyphenol hydroxylase [Duganella sp. CF402]